MSVCSAGKLGTFKIDSIILGLATAGLHTQFAASDIGAAPFQNKHSVIWSTMIYTLTLYLSN